MATHNRDQLSNIERLIRSLLRQRWPYCVYDFRLRSRTSKVVMTVTGASDSTLCKLESLAPTQKKGGPSGPPTKGYSRAHWRTSKTRRACSELANVERASAGRRCFARFHETRTENRRGAERQSHKSGGSGQDGSISAAIPKPRNETTTIERSMVPCGRKED
jgi:hypothetical protein